MGFFRAQASAVDRLLACLKVTLLRTLARACSLLNAVQCPVLYSEREQKALRAQRISHLRD